MQYSSLNKKIMDYNNYNLKLNCQRNDMLFLIETYYNAKTVFVQSVQGNSHLPFPLKESPEIILTLRAPVFLLISFISGFGLSGTADR